MKVCVRCGFEFSKRNCPECMKERNRIYYENHKDKINRASRLWAENNKEKHEAAWRKRRKEKADEINKTYQKYLIQNKERIFIVRAEYRIKNKEKIEKNHREWRSKNIDIVRTYCQNRYARIKFNGGRLSRDIIKKLFVLQKGLCVCCKKPLLNNFHIDHIIPLSKGGANVDTNVQLLRASCNIKKSAKDPIDFMRERGFLL